MGIREEHRAETLRRIQKATLDLIEEQGLEATTIGHISARAGLSERTFFRYYLSKEHAALPGQQDVNDAMANVEITGSGMREILAELLVVCRHYFALEVEHQEFRRISRLLVQEPELLRAVAQQERLLVVALSDNLAQRTGLNAMQALLVAEIVTAGWRVAWQSFAKDEASGIESDPVAAFDQTVKELKSLFG